MRKLRYLRAARRGAVALAMALGLAVAASPARAIFSEADFIETDGSVSTVDLWFFEVFTDDPLLQATVKANDVSGLVDGADPDMIVYLDDATFSTIVAVDNAAGADPEIELFAGAYVAVIANHPLAAGEFGPTQADTALALSGYEYEFNGPDIAGTEVAINCLLSGNLGGGYDKEVFPLGADTCQLPPVPEPATLGLFVTGLIGLGVAARRRGGR